MKFHFNNLILWLKNGKVRTLTFQPNKVNIITGDSNTGKTAILDIIDYCIFASRHKISDSMINENVAWYGIRFSVNDKYYTIARKAPTGSSVSDEYFFSSIGEVPETITKSDKIESSLKKILESEFSINSDTKISYGSNAMAANSKISLRYFLLFNTISQDIITHSEEFFDKQKDTRYRDALPRAFDLAVGIDTVENILKKEKRESIEKEIKKLEKEDGKRSRKQDTFYTQLAGIVKQAKEFGLIPDDAEMEDAVAKLNDMVKHINNLIKNGPSDKYDQISKKINIIVKKISNLERFSKEYKNYKENLKTTLDSLKPINFLKDHYSDIIKTSIYHEIISALEQDYSNIKNAVKNKTPLDGNISDIIKSYNEELNALHGQQSLLPEEIKTFESEKEKYIFIGEVKAKLALYDKDNDIKEDDNTALLSRLTGDLNNLNVADTQNSRDLFIKLLDETIQDYISEVSDALVNYSEYRSSFNYKEKKLQLRKPKTDFIDNIGSSSNHMFLHLFLFLGLHKIIMDKDAPYVPPFLVIDQFSRPYWGQDQNDNKILNNNDIFKVKAALKLLNTFVGDSVKSDKEFQIIVFEHIEKELWEDLNNVHLVEEFINGNALIPASMLS